MDDKKLEYFISAVECGSFTKAAKKCFISQTGLSQQISAMEHELGFKLFDRSTYRPKLTKAGEIFYKGSKELLDKYYLTVRDAKNSQNGYDENFIIGISSPLDTQIIPHILNVLMERHSNINFEIIDGSYEQQAKRLENNEIDVILGIIDDIKPLKNAIYYPVLVYQLCAITSFDHKWAGKKEISGAELEGENLIIFSKKSGRHSHNSMIMACRKDGFEPNILKEVDSLNAMVTLIKSKQGVGLTAMEFMDGQSDINMVLLKNTHHHAEYCVAKNKKNNKKLTDEFIEITLKYFYEKYTFGRSIEN